MHFAPTVDVAQRDYTNWLAGEVGQGRRDLLDELVTNVARFVYKRANYQMARWHLPESARDDLAQEGFLAVILCAGRYDARHDSHCSFLTFAGYSIDERMRRWIDRFRFQVAMSPHLRSRKFKLLRQRVVASLRAGIELDAPEYRSDPTRGYLGEHFTRDDSEDVDPENLSFRRDLFDHLFGLLTNRERMVVALRMDGLTLDETAAEMMRQGDRPGASNRDSKSKTPLSRERVRQINNEAIQKMIFALRRWDLISQVRTNGFSGTGTSEWSRRNSFARLTTRSIDGPFIRKQSAEPIRGAL